MSLLFCSLIADLWQHTLSDLWMLCNCTSSAGVHRKINNISTYRPGLSARLGCKKKIIIITVGLKKKKALWRLTVVLLSLLHCLTDNYDHLNHHHSSTEGLTHVGCVGWGSRSGRGWIWRLEGLCCLYQAFWHCQEQPVPLSALFHRFNPQSSCMVLIENINLYYSPSQYYCYTHFGQHPSKHFDFRMNLVIMYLIVTNNF